MENLINLYSWIINQQNFLKIEGTNYNLSIVPEYVYKYRNSVGHIISSKTPVGIKINCALILHKEFVDYIEFTEETDFFNYLSLLKINSHDNFMCTSSF
jgi:hypothetical protein